MANVWAHHLFKREAGVRQQRRAEGGEGKGKHPAHL